MTSQICEKCNCKMDYIRMDIHFGQPIKIYQCPKCKEIKPVLPDKT